MLTSHFFTLLFVVAAVAKPTSPSTDVLFPADHSYESFDTENVGLSTDGSLPLQKRKCNIITLCTGRDFSGNCSNWCYPKDMLVAIHHPVRKETSSVRLPEGKCWFYAYVRIWCC